jgi:hypothetical protein
VKSLRRQHSLFQNKPKTIKHLHLFPVVLQEAFFFFDAPPLDSRGEYIPHVKHRQCPRDRRADGAYPLGGA